MLSIIGEVMTLKLHAKKNVLRTILLTMATGLLTLSSCGQFTNLPAQVKLGTSSEKIDLGATVTYKIDDKNIAVEASNPTLILEGEAGSVGVTYNELTIEYLPKDLPLGTRVLTVAVNVRVPSSHKFDKDGNIVQGRTELTIPVVSNQIIGLGDPNAPNRIRSQISAKVSLSGTDDAGIFSVFDTFVPINFITTGLPNTSGG